MDWNQLLQTAWTHLQPYLLLAACYVVLLCWKAAWSWAHEWVDARRKAQDSKLLQAEDLIIDAMLRVEEDEAKALREASDGGITPIEGRALLEKAVSLSTANVKPLIAGIMADPETWIKNKITAQLAKWKAKLPFQFPKPNTIPPLPAASVKDDPGKVGDPLGDAPADGSGGK